MKVSLGHLSTMKPCNNVFKEKLVFLNYKACKNYSIITSTLNSVKINSTRYYYVLICLKVNSFGITQKAIISVEQDCKKEILWISMIYLPSLSAWENLRPILIAVYMK